MDPPITFHHFQPFLFQSPNHPPNASGKVLRIVCISDTHGLHRGLVMPKGDILIHAGDFSLFGRDEDAIDFNDWLGELDYEHIIVVEGNHDASYLRKNGLSNASSVLSDTSVTIQGIKIHGCRFNWCMKRGSRNPNYDLIDNDVDIIISHNPAKGFVDGGGKGKGCPVLLQRIKEIRPKLVVSGHVHGGRGVKRAGWFSGLRGTVFVNAAVVSDHHTLKRHPIIIDNFSLHQ